MRNTTILTAAFVGFLLAVSAVPAQADVFTDRAAFDAANPGLPLLDFEGIVPEGEYVLSPDFSALGVTFSDPYGDPSWIAVIDSSFYNTPSDVLMQAEYTTLMVTFDPPVPAVGFDVAIWDMSGLNNTTVTVELFSGAVQLLTTTFDAADPTQFDVFRGFSNLGADITSMLIAGPDYFQFEMIDNFSHGVPEPATLALLSLGALLAVRKR